MDPKTNVIYARVSAGLHERAKRRADAEQRSLSSLVALALETYMRKTKTPPR